MYIMKKELALVLLGCLFFVSANAQKRDSVKNMYAYFKVTMPGMARQDENGNTINPQPSVNRYLYVEVTGKSKLIFDTIIYDGIAYKVYAAEAINGKVEVGKGFLDNKNIVLQASKNNVLWYVLINPKTAVSKSAEPSKNIVFKGKIGKDNFKVNLKKEIQIETMPSY
jgi:hypothetical protein